MAVAFHSDDIDMGEEDSTVYGNVDTAPSQGQQRQPHKKRQSGKILKPSSIKCGVKSSTMGWMDWLMKMYQQNNMWTQ